MPSGTHGARIHYRRRLALVGALCTALEAVAVGLPLSVYLPLDGAARVLLGYTAPLVLGGAWLMWWVALRYWRGPLDRVASRISRGETVPRAELALAARAAQRLPARAAGLRVALATAALLGLGVLLWRHAGLAARSLVTVASVAVFHGLAVAVLRGLAWARVLGPVEAGLGQESDARVLYAERYRPGLLRAGLATSVLVLLGTTAFTWFFLPLPRERYAPLDTWLPLTLLALGLLWLALALRLLRPLERHLAAAAESRSSRDDEAGQAAFLVAQALPYRLAVAKLVVSLVGAALLLAQAHWLFAVTAETAFLVYCAAALLTVGAVLREALWHRSTLRPLLAQLAARHRPAPDAARTPLGLRAKMLAAFGGLTLFVCGLSLFWAFAQHRAFVAGAPPSPRVLPYFLVALLGFSLGLVILVSDDLTRPLRELERRAEAMARGDLGRPVTLGAGELDEVGRLALALETMRRALSDRLRSSTEINLSLEVQVQRRTTELERRNRELHEALEALRRAQAELVRSEKLASMGRLVAGIAHEINNPVNAVVNTAGPLESTLAALLDGARTETERQEAAEDVREMLRVIQSGARRTKEIVQALHNYSRSDEQTFGRVDVRRGLDESLELLRHQLRGAIQVERDYDKGGEAGAVLGNEGQLQQVFVNLLVNAAQALGERGGTLRVTTERRGDRVLVHIADDGPGIPEAILPRIFDPFFTTKDVGQGSGLGLSIVHGIVERHGGSIDVESHVGQGTTFTLSLPAAKR